MQQVLLIAVLTCSQIVLQGTEDVYEMPTRFMCDGNVDCSDGSDEDNNVCLKPPRKTVLTNFRYSLRSRKCPSTWFFCVDGSNCIAPRYVCDRFKDCRDGSDESEFCHGLDSLKRKANDKVAY